MHTRLRVIFLVLLFSLSACNLTTEPPIQQLPTPTGPISARPVVVITSPQDGSEYTVDQQILVSTSATDSVGVTRVQLLANGRIVKTISSESPTGSQTLNAVLDFTPREVGTVNLSVVAYRSSIASDPALISVTVRAAQAQVTATSIPNPGLPIIDPNDPTCRVLTNVGLNVRQGPGTNYPRISVLAAGTVVPVTGRNGSNTWWQVRVGTTIGWVTNDFVIVYGNCLGIPVVQPPPPPTNTPQPATATPILPTFTPIVIPPTATPGLADLVISNISGSTNLSLGVGGVTSNYSITVTNTGQSPTGQFNNVITILPDNVTVPVAVVASLGAGESIILNASISFTAAGSYTLQARTDSDSQVTEQSEVNNVGILNVTVTSP
jgi:uncharacterized protein YraI